MQKDKQQIKKVVFYCDEEVHARFLSKLRYFGFKRQAELFRFLLKSIADFDDEIVKSFASLLEGRNKTKSAKIVKEIEISENNLYDENLNVEDIEEIYGLLKKGDFLDDEEELY
jgi:hypothetical protein